jgi:hypothetical protein
MCWERKEVREHIDLLFILDSGDKGSGSDLGVILTLEKLRDSNCQFVSFGLVECICDCVAVIVL